MLYIYIRIKNKLLMEKKKDLTYKTNKDTSQNYYLKSVFQIIL